MLLLLWREGEGLALTGHSYPLPPAPLQFETGDLAPDAETVHLEPLTSPWSPSSLPTCIKDRGRSVVVVVGVWFSNIHQTFQSSSLVPREASWWLPCAQEAINTDAHCSIVCDSEQLEAA